MRSDTIKCERLIKWIYCGYIVLLVLFFLLDNSQFPQYDIASEQILMWALAYILTLFSFKSSCNVIAFSVLFFQLIAIFYVRHVNISLFGDPLGYDPHDALLYRECGEIFGGRDIRTFFLWMIATYGSLDDWGFPLIVWGVYGLFGNNGDIILLLLNACFIALGTKFIYKISSLFVAKDYCGLISLFWGFAPFAVCTATGGLKENFFCFFIIRFFYDLLYNKKSLSRTVLIIADIFGIFLFRLSVGYAALISLFLYMLLKKALIRKHLKSIVVIGLVIGGLAFPIIVQKIADQRGLTYESVMASSSTKAENAGGASAFLANGVSALFGPYPTFTTGDEDKINYITRYSFTLYIKVILSFFFFYALVISLKAKNSVFYPLFLFVFVNMLMIIFAFFALNVRFHWPHIPIFFLISVCGLIEYMNRAKNHIILTIYFLISFVVIVLYNIR